MIKVHQISLLYYPMNKLSFNTFFLRFRLITAKTSVVPLSRYSAAFGDEYIFKMRILDHTSSSVVLIIPNDFHFCLRNAKMSIRKIGMHYLHFINKKPYLCFIAFERWNIAISNHPIECFTQKNII